METKRNWKERFLMSVLGCFLDGKRLRIDLTFSQNEETGDIECKSESEMSVVGRKEDESDE